MGATLRSGTLENDFSNHRTIEQRSTHDMTLFGKASILGTAMGVLAVFLTAAT